MHNPKAVLVTGASSGIGYYCAKALQADGYKVIASCRKLADVSRLQAEGLTCIQLDLNYSNSIQWAAKQTLELCQGNLYGLFNNGAYGQPGAVEDLSRDALRQQFETNVFGWLELTNALLPTMIERSCGRIIQNSSILGFAAMPFRGAYNASKFALEGLTDTLRLELIGSGVYVSLIEPGPILSDFRKNALIALKSHINIDQSRFKDNYTQSIERLGKVGAAASFTLGPDAIYKRLKHALESDKPKARYYVTLPTYMMGYLKRILSTKLMDKILQRAAN